MFLAQINNQTNVCPPQNSSTITTQDPRNMQWTNTRAATLTDGNCNLNHIMQLRNSLSVHANVYHAKQYAMVWIKHIETSPASSIQSNIVTRTTTPRYGVTLVLKACIWCAIYHARTAFNIPRAVLLSHALSLRDVPLGAA